MKLKNLIFDNIAIKIISIIFAIILWFYVASKDRIEVNFVVPLELKNIPTSTVTSGKVVDRVDIRLSGREGLLRRLNQKQISATLNLAGALPGENTFYLGPENFNLPPAVEIAGINPAVVKIKLEPLASRHPRPERGSSTKGKGVITK